MTVQVYPSAPGATMAEALAAEIRKTCAARSGLQAYLVVDAGRASDIKFIIETLSDDALCLFDGNAFDDLSGVAPWLVPIGGGSDDMYDWFMQEGHGKDWGILLFAEGAPRKIKTSLKRSLRVQDEDGRALYFKYYRPSVFNAYLPAMEPEQAAYILRDFDQVWAEDPDDPGRMRRYAMRDGTLRRVDLALVVSETA